MKRTIYEDLLAWKASPKRKPLMLYGARQVGKTYILKEFGRNEFDGMVYINCYKNPDMESLFSIDADVDRLLVGLSALGGTAIVPEKTLVFLDEVQEIPDVVASLKYFCEDRPEICIAVAGSLLGVMDMEGCSFPTGKVDMLNMYPMTFIEFLRGVGEEGKADVLESGDWDVINALSTSLIELLRQYYFVGGMPEAVADYAERRDTQTVRKIQNEILLAYEADIAKHAGSETLRARMVLQSVPAQLAKENKKFIFGALRKGARASEFEKAIQWLVDARIIYRLNRLSKVEVPFSFYEDFSAFKLYFLDVGLLGAMSNVPASQVLIGDNVFKEYKGAFSENYVLTQIKAATDDSVAYYSKEKSTMEIDFLIQTEGKAVPVEVKAEENVKSKSLRLFVTEDNAGKEMHGYRLSMKGYQPQGWMTNITLFAVTPFIRALDHPED